MYQLIETQLRQPIFEHFLSFEQALLPVNSQTLQHAVAVALRTQNIGTAFAAGYRCALQALIPDLNSHQWVAMCVTESEGNHPRNIKTQIDEKGRLIGSKSFVTLIDRAETLVVLAKAGEHENRPVLKAVLCDAHTDGVKLTTMPPMPMIPEISHGSVEFRDAPARLLVGDGYLDYSKRFRSLEDLHVVSSFTALMLSVCYRHKLSAELIEQALVILLSLPNEIPEESAWFHLHLSGLFDGFRELVSAFENNLELLPETFRSAWLRDKKLFSIANKARQTRKVRAAEQIFSL